VAWPAWQASGVAAPSGTVTFLFTDIEGSTRLWESAPASMQEALEEHDRIVRDAVNASGGYVFATGGDGFAAAFARAGDAMNAATDARRALEDQVWPSDAIVRVRMGLHTGEAVERGGDYFGPAVNRAARLLAIAHGGQIVCSQSMAAVIGPSEELRSLGQHRLRDLGAPEQVFQVGDGSFPPLRSLDVRSTNLPAQRTSFIGRERELKTVLDAIAHSRLVTLTGVGGVGKTRLALEAAAHALIDMPDGAWLVELGAVADADAVADVTASALGVLPRPGRSAWEAVVAYLHNRRLLLIVDNCEHLIDAVAARIDDVLRSCPRVSVLSTSREALAVDGEQIVPVPTLTDVDDAVRLLVERALTVRPDLSLTPSTQLALEEVCHRLDGIPLAIELAAARLRSMTPEELGARLDERFRLLVGGRRVAVSRHQTLRSTIDWSYDLLDGTERAVLQRVAIFAGGFDVPAAAALCNDVDDDLFETVTQLSDKSLVIADATGTRTRYRMLETIRDYALERLRAEGDIDAVRRRHATYFAQWSAEAGAGLRGPHEADWVDLIDLEMENLRTALLWALEARDADLSTALVVPLMLEILPTDETVGGWAEQCLTLPGIEAHPLYPQVAAFAAYVLVWRGRLEDGRALLTAARRAMEAGGASAATLVRVLSSEAIAATGLSGFVDAARIGQERVAAARLTGDEYELCRALGGYSSVQAHLVVEDALAPAEEAVALARRIGNPLLLSSSLFALAQATVPLGSGRAIELYKESEAQALASRNDRMLTVVQGLQAQLLYSAGDLRGVGDTVLRTVELEWARRRHLQTSYATVEILGMALAARGCDETAAIVEGACSRVVASVPRARDELELRLGTERYAELFARGAALEEAELVERVRAAVAELHAH